MKLNHFHKVILLTLSVVCLLACNDDEKNKFILDIGSNSIEVPMQRVCDFSIISGNGDYTFNIDNSEIIAVSFVPDYNMPFGVIRIEGKQKGEATLSVTDNATLTTIELPIKVTDNYLGFYITETNHPALTLDRWVYLVANEAKDVYFFESDPNSRSPKTLISRGTFAFSLENGNPFLTLYYSEDNGKFTEADIAPSAHKFNLQKSKLNTLGLLRYYMKIDSWEELLPKTRTSVIAPVFINMEEEGSNHNITGRFSRELMPENILK